MNADRLLGHYEQVADAPDAIARLRRFILDLAVRGKLVPQDPNDEPASELLERIAAERKKRIARGEIRRAKPLNSITHTPFDPPSDWTWLPLGETGNIFTGNSINVETREQLEKTEEGRPFIATKDVGYGFEEIDYANGLLVELSDERFKIARSDSVLICAEGGSAGRKIALTDREISFGNKLLANETWSVISPKFVLCVYLSDFFYTQFAEKMTGVIGGISLRNFLQLPFPLPPLAEQRRIVAKVDELMALCDRIAAARTEREATRDQLSAASLVRLDAPDPNPVVFQNHAAFALENLVPLTTRTDQIKALRQTILNLAVRGKLVEQDPNDDPAAELLKRIAADRVTLEKNGSLKKPEPLPPVDAADTPFDLPSRWAWARFPEIGTFGRGKSKHRPRNDPLLYNGGKYPFIQTGDVARSGGSIKTYSNLYNDVGLAQSAMWPTGTLCITIAANIADSGILAFDACFPDSVVGLIAHNSFEGARFFEYFIRTAKADLHEFAPSTAQKNINLGILTEVLIPLPPLAEQHRIVAKIDELMGLCDQMEVNLATGEGTRRRLLDALLHEVLPAGRSTLHNGVTN